MKIHQVHLENEILEVEKMEVMMFMGFPYTFEHNVQYGAHLGKEAQAFLKLYQTPHQHCHHE